MTKTVERYGITRGIQIFTCFECASNITFSVYIWLGESRVLKHSERFNMQSTYLVQNDWTSVFMQCSNIINAHAGKYWLCTAHTTDAYPHRQCYYAVWTTAVMAAKDEHACTYEMLPPTSGIMISTSHKRWQWENAEARVLYDSLCCAVWRNKKEPH